MEKNFTTLIENKKIIIILKIEIGRSRDVKTNHGMPLQSQDKSSAHRLRFSHEKTRQKKIK